MHIYKYILISRGEFSGNSMDQLEEDPCEDVDEGEEYSGSSADDESGRSNTPVEEGSALRLGDKASFR